MSNADDLYAEEHTPDPVTRDAVAAAMAATTNSRKLSVSERFANAFLIVLAVVVTVATMLGLINAVSINSQGKRLTEQNKCLTSLVQNFLQDQQNRSIVAADDRNAVRDLINDVTSGRTLKEKQQAITDFNTRSKLNDARRANIPTITRPQCSGIHLSSLVIPSAIQLPTPSRSASKVVPPQAPVTPQISPTSPAGPVSNPKKAPNSAPRTSVGGGTAPTHLPTPSRTPGPTHLPTPRHTPIPTVPVPAPSPPPPAPSPISTIKKILCGLGVCLH